MEPRMDITGDSESRLVKTSSGGRVLVAKVPQLGLYLVTDADNWGPHWVKVTYSRGVFTTHYLLGADEDAVCPIARFFAQRIMGVKTVGGGDRDGDVGQGADHMLPDRGAKEILFNISLRKSDPQTVREIADHL